MFVQIKLCGADTHSLQRLDDSSSRSRRRSKLNTKSEDTSLTLGSTPFSSGLIKNIYSSVKEGGKVVVKIKEDAFRRLILFFGVDQQVNKNKGKTFRKMGGGSSPACSVKDRLKLQRLQPKLEACAVHACTTAPCRVLP